MSKRILSLVLALVMVLGTFGTVFAAETAAVSVEKEAAAFLKEAGVLQGDNEGNLNLDLKLERRDVIILLSRLMDDEEVAEKFPTEVSPTWEDARTDAYYTPFFAWAEVNKLFAGKTAKELAPRDAMTAQEYAVVLLRVLGHEADGHDAWKTAIKDATALGILADVTVEDTDEITRGQMSVMTFNALGVLVKDSAKTLAETLGIEMPEAPKADKLTAKVLDTENLSEIVVELSNVELVKSQDALLSPDNYRLDKTDAKVQHVHLDGDNVVLTLVPYGSVKEQPTFSALAKGKTFDLTIRNVDNAINTTYKNIVAGDNEILEVTNVDYMGDYGIKVTTSEPIANPLERNFVIDARTSMVVEQYGRDIILTPYHGRAFDKDAVKLTIDKLVDFAGYTTVKADHAMEISTDEALPTVERSYRSGSKLVVEFDRDVYADSISAYENRRELGNVSFSERRVEFYAEKAEKVATNVVEYTFSRDIPRGVEVVIVDVANHFNKAMDKDVIVPTEYKDDYAPVILSSTANVALTQAQHDAYVLATNGFTKAQLDAWKKANVVDTGNMTIVFDKDIKEFETLKVADVKVEDFFTLYELDITTRGKSAAEDVKINVVSVGRDRIVLSFDDIKLNNSDRDFDYILEVRDLSDLSRNRMDRDYKDFQVVPVSSIYNVTSLDYKDSSYFNRPGVEMTLVFNKYVDQAEASNPKNYYLDGKLSVDEAIVERDGLTVSLVIYDTTVAKLLANNKVLEISPRVHQLGETNAVANRFWDVKNKVAIIDTNVVDNLSAVKFMVGAHTLIDEELEEYEVYQNVTGSGITMTAKYDAKADVLVTMSLLDKDGKLVAGQMKSDVVTTTASGVTLNVQIPDNIAGKFTVRVAVDGEVYNLPVKVIGTEANFVVKYNDVVLSSYTLASELDESKLSIELASDSLTAEITSITKIPTGVANKHRYQVIVTPEFGAAMVYGFVITDVPAI